jgi:hypothetical protein
MFDLLKNLKICQVFCLTLQAKTSNLCHNIWPFLSNLEEFTKKFTKFSFLKLGCCNLTLSKQKNNAQRILTCFSLKKLKEMVLLVQKIEFQPYDGLRKPKILNSDEKGVFELKYIENSLFKTA